MCNIDFCSVNKQKHSSFIQLDLDVNCSVCRTIFFCFYYRVSCLCSSQLMDLLSTKWLLKWRWENWPASILQFYSYLFLEEKSLFHIFLIHKYTLFHLEQHLEMETVQDLNWLNYLENIYLIWEIINHTVFVWIFAFRVCLMLPAAPHRNICMYRTRSGNI